MDPGPPSASMTATSEAATNTAATSTAATSTGAGSATVDPGPPAWDVKIVVDPSLDTDPDPEYPPPLDAGERMFPVDLPEMLIGRRDDKLDIRPEIPVQDPAVSRRHAQLVRLPDDGVAVVDLASANGTALNGTELVAGQRQELGDGDAITLGRWTRVTVHRRPVPAP